MSKITQRQHITSSAGLLEVFITKYLTNVGIQIQIVEMIAKELFGQTVGLGGAVSEEVAQTPFGLYISALEDISAVNNNREVTFDLDRLIEGAASFEFIVRYARKVDSRVLPNSVVPLNKDVEYLLAIFHENMRNQA